MKRLSQLQEPSKLVVTLAATVLVLSVLSAVEQEEEDRDELPANISEFNKSINSSEKIQQCLERNGEVLNRTGIDNETVYQVCRFT
jgi:septal ring factor EnvC (AmiA/AmiB activator)